MHITIVCDVTQCKSILAGESGGFRPLGNLTYLRVWHDNSGKGHGASWYLKYIVVHDVLTKQKYYFLCNRWLAVEHDDGMVRSPSVWKPLKILLFLNLFHFELAIFTRKGSNTVRENKTAKVFAFSWFMVSLFDQNELRQCFVELGTDCSS